MFYNYLKEKQCVQGYFTGRFEELGRYIEKLEEVYKKKGIFLMPQLILVETFYFGEGKNEQVIGEYYIPIQEKT